MKRRTRLSPIFAILFISTVKPLLAQNQATWIWYPGDFEIWLGNNMQNRRTERTTLLPPSWKLDIHYNIDFHKDFDLSQAEDVELVVKGKYNVKFSHPLSSQLKPQTFHSL